MNVYAVSLDDFAEKIKTVDIKSIRFHMQRKDFENWIDKAVGDKELAQKVGAINEKKMTDNQFRLELIKIIKARTNQIKEVLKAEEEEEEVSEVESELQKIGESLKKITDFKEDDLDYLINKIDIVMTFKKPEDKLMMALGKSEDRSNILDFCKVMSQNILSLKNDNFSREFIIEKCQKIVDLKEINEQEKELRLLREYLKGMKEAEEDIQKLEEQILEENLDPEG